MCVLAGCGCNRDMELWRAFGWPAHSSAEFLNGKPGSLVRMLRNVPLADRFQFVPNRLRNHRADRIVNCSDVAGCRLVGDKAGHRKPLTVRVCR